MPPRPPLFILANSSSCRVLDRFSDLPDDVPVQEDEEGRIPFWPLLQHLLCLPVSTVPQLIDRLQTIAANAGTGQVNDYGSLKNILESQDEIKLFGTTWPNMRDIALQLPTYFPSGQLELLATGLPLHLSRGQVACLVVHQFLCSATPQRDDEGYQDSSIWYSSEQRHPAAADMYLKVLLAYFESLPRADALMQDYIAVPGRIRNCVTYQLYQKVEEVSLEDVKMTPVNVRYLDAHTTDAHDPQIQGSGGAVVVSANKVIGFGQSATQEEIFVGITPEAYPVVFVAPHLEANTVITVSGVRAMADVKGQRREIVWKLRPAPSPTENFKVWKKGWQGGRLVFMDALEMDMLEGSTEGPLPDLLSENIDREICKAVAGFESYEGDAVFTGLWGCGAFGGDPGVKLIVLWVAAATAGVVLHLVLGPGEHDLGRAFERAVTVSDGMPAKSLRKMLSRVPRTLRREGILEWIEEAVSGAR
ncbi:poly(adp-ribose) glycohydrolase [Fusarium albosuccineum]|uniref:poly(ADP-ribose) glycohydrolase n=1 Tax=Fusarium albosuccineum TaxID=1237068 RepID=A0A8H4LLV7_9HYPO|nr:poly(adp-ribose) glycohydrolase [Fusarium albosuccineum]